MGVGVNRPAGTSPGGGVKVKVDKFRSGDHRVKTDGDLPPLGSRFPQGHCRHHWGASQCKLISKDKRENEQHVENEGEIEAKKIGTLEKEDCFLFFFSLWLAAYNNPVTTAFCCVTYGHD